MDAPPDDADQETDDALRAWQEWVLATVEDLRQAGVSRGPLPWDHLPDGIAACIEVRGSARELGRRVQASQQLFLGWCHRTRRPSFAYLLRTCYVLGLSPLQLMSTGGQVMPAALVSGSPLPVPMPRRTGPPPADITRIEAFLQAVLAGHERPRAAREVARHLGVGEKFLVKRYPRESAQITAQYQAYRAERARQKVVGECEAVRQATLAIHEKGAFPSLARVARRLPDPHILRRPEAKEVWRTVRRELGYTF